MKIIITKTKPEFLFSFLEAISSLQPCTVEQIRKYMKSIWSPVRSARNFASQYGLISIDEESRKFSLTTNATRLLRYTDNGRIDFLIYNIKLQEKEPFLSLQYELSLSGKKKIREIGEFLDTKFMQKKKLDTKEKDEYGKTLSEWLVLLRIAKKDGDVLTYSKGIVKTFEIIVIPEMKQLLDRTLYDFLTENFHTSHNMLDKPYGLLDKTNSALDDKRKGELFESFIGSIFTRLGFSSRLKDGIREKHTNLTLKRKGGGDVAIFCHFPIPTEIRTYHGYAIACEGKATKNVIGSKAVGQTRNLCKKIQEIYPQYLVHTIITSQSTCGYDSSGKEQAPPEVLHLTNKTLLSALDLQKKRLEAGLSLITPIHIMLSIEELIREQNLNPTPKKFVKTIEEILEK